MPEQVFGDGVASCDRAGLRRRGRLLRQSGSSATGSPPTTATSPGALGSAI